MKLFGAIFGIGADRTHGSARIEKGGPTGKGTRMLVEQVFRLADGRTIFIGPVAGGRHPIRAVNRANRCGGRAEPGSGIDGARVTKAEPGFWWLWLKGEGLVLRGSEAAVVVRKGRDPRGAIVIESLNEAAVVSHEGPLQLFEIIEG